MTTYLRFYNKMVNNPYKIVLTSPDGRQFIRYKHRKADLFIEVFEFDGIELLNHKVENMEKAFTEAGVPYVDAETEFNNRYYLLVVLDILPHKIEPTQEGADRLFHPMRRLADWYKYTYLIPRAKGTLSTPKPPAEDAGSIR